LNTQSNIDFPNRFQTLTFTFANTTAFTYYRLNLTNNSGTILQLAEWEIYGTASGSTNTPTPAATATNTPTVLATATNTPTFTPAPTVTPSTTNVAKGKTATASSTEAAGYAASYAVDGNAGTRWASAYSDPQWIKVDLGSAMSIKRVKLTWEAAYGKSFTIQTSTNNSTWTNVYSTTTGTGGTTDTTFTARSARYVRMYGTVRGTGWGYSIWELEVYQ
jgi:hypothetical protein